MSKWLAAFLEADSDNIHSVTSAEIAKKAKNIQYVPVKASFGNSGNFDIQLYNANWIQSIPAEWSAAFARMEGCTRPAKIPESRWRHIKNNLPILSKHIAEIIRCGWSVADIFSCHKSSPENRYAEMGLLMLLGTSEIILVEGDRIVIRTRTGAEQSYRRNKGSAAEQAMIWELADMKKAVI